MKISYADKHPETEETVKVRKVIDRRGKELTLSAHPY